MSECKHSNGPITEEYRYHVFSEENNNCVLCLIENVGRPLSQSEVAEVLGVSKMRISQIEKIASKKFNRRFGMKFGKKILLD